MGQTLTIGQWAKKYGLNYCTLYRRVVIKKMNLKDALFNPLRGKGRGHIKVFRRSKLKAFGRSQTFSEWAAETGIRVDTIQARIRVWGWTPEEAVSTKTLRKGETLHYKGLTAFGQTKSLTKWALEYGMSPSTLRRRLMMGMPVELAIKVPSEHNKRKKETA